MNEILLKIFINILIFPVFIQVFKKNINMKLVSIFSTTLFFIFIILLLITQQISIFILAIIKIAIIYVGILIVYHIKK